MITILVVDDDLKLLNMLRRTLVYEGFNVITATDGKSALAQTQTHQPDIIVLDWVMPKLDGLGVIKQLRAANNKTLVLMLSARSVVEDRVTGLESGADDYLTKPFAPKELVARIHALLRHVGTTTENGALIFADLYLNPVTREARRGDRAFELTSKEFELLQYLMRHPREVLQRERILQEVWKYNFGDEDNILDVYMGYLRKKTEAGNELRLIQTVRAVGYVLREE